MGAPKAEIDRIVAAQAPAEPSDYSVLPECEEALDLFLSVSTQWNCGGMGNVIGLNYQSVEFVAKMKGYQGEKLIEIFDDLQWIERGALKVFQAPREEPKHGP